MKTLRSSSITIVCSTILLAVTASAHAATINYVTNGSFESGFSNWTVTTGPGAVNPGTGPSIVTTDGSYVNIYGDVIPSDNAVSPYPDLDKGGTQAAYFVDDVATESLKQTMYLHAGTYEVGFDLFETLTGASNPNDSTFLATVAGVTILSSDVGAFIAGEWEHFGGNVTVASSGYYDVSFLFQGGVPSAKDVVVDDVYVNDPPSLPGLGVIVDVPEPNAGGVLAVGLGVIGLMRGRRYLPRCRG